MPIYAHDVMLKVDGVETCIELDDTYPSIEDWKTAATFAIELVRSMYPESVHIELLTVSTFEAEEYANYGYIHDAPCVLQ